LAASFISANHIIVETPATAPGLTDHVWTIAELIEKAPANVRMRWTALPAKRPVANSTITKSRSISLMRIEACPSLPSWDFALS
jgi:hypothetical protein